ncbi:MAG: sigma 54-interacting transcriptional regulator [Myxococcota bacterium]
MTEHGLASESAVPRPGLVQVWGPGGVTRRAWPVSGSMPIGREAPAEVLLDDAKVSRHHATVSMRRGALTLVDEGSRNGTLLDGEPIEGEVALREGSVLRLGRCLLMAVADAPRHRPGAEAGLDGRLIGGPSLAEVRRAIRHGAQASLPCLIEGETGTGKERVAEAFHFATGRAGELVATNCAALPETLIESELFGHVRGAYSGSAQDRAGLFVRADGGSLFLDEIGEIPLEVQAKLLRVLEDGQVRPIGADRARRVNAQLLAASNRDLAAMVEAGGFRRDLFHRLAIHRIRLPPLRDRREDIPALVDHFREPDEPPASAAILERWMLHDWPGNVRELRGAVRLAMAKARLEGADEVLPRHLPPLPPLPAGTPRKAASMERQQIEAELRRQRGRVTDTCRALGVSRSWFYEKIRRLEIDPNDFRG